MSSVTSYIQHLTGGRSDPAANGQRNTLMSEDRPVTLDFIAAQLQRVLSEIRVLRDDVDVLTAILRRLDNNQALMLDQLRAMHAG
jgi:hypothetical protein